MDKTFFIGKWEGEEFILVDMSMAESVLDENGDVNDDIDLILPLFTVDIREDGSFELVTDKEVSGKWIEIENGIGLIPEDAHAKLKTICTSEAQMAMPFVREGDKIWGDFESYKIKFSRE